MLGSALGYKQPVSPRTLGRYRRQHPLAVTRDGTANQYSKREATRWCRRLAKSPSWSYIAEHAQPISVDNIRLTTLPVTAAATPDPAPDPDPVEPWESVLQRAGHSDGPRREQADDHMWVSSSSLMRPRAGTGAGSTLEDRLMRNPGRLAAIARKERANDDAWDRYLAEHDGRF